MKEKRIRHDITWSAADIANLRRMREVERKTWKEIDRALNRALGSSCGKYARLRAIDRADEIAQEKREAKAERERLRGLSHLTITAAVFGDPLPGRSALDRMHREALQ
jgi:hypothetical protein